MCISLRHAPAGRAALALALLFAAVVTPGCSAAESTGSSAPPQEAEAESVAQLADAALETLASVHSGEINNELLAVVTAPWTGDLDSMVERRMLRALVVYSGTFYFLDGGTQKGITYEALQLFEKQLNEKLGSGTLKVVVTILPVRRDQLIPFLLEGRGDIAAANLTITPERLEQVDFSDAAYDNISEVVVTGPAGPELSSVDDLAGLEINVRQSSSYWTSLQRLNERFRAAGKPEMTLTPASETLEDEDLLQMVNASLLPLAVVDSHKADFWEDVFTHMTVHRDIAVNTGGQIAWAFRKNSPLLAAEVNDFIGEHKQGTLLGNILLKRYLQSGKYVENVFANQGQERFEETIEFFAEYADRYEFDWLMVTAQAYQESRLDQSLVSPVGAVGVMQLLPSTAADPNVGIPDIHELEDNIHAGVKYLRFISDRYYSGPEVDAFNAALFSFASYNAGPARINRLRREAEEVGLDPNVWFNNVEVMAARDIGRETVDYVANIFKYYIAYEQIVKGLRARGRGPGVRF